MIPLRLAAAVQDPDLAAAVQCCTRGLPVRVVLSRADIPVFAREVKKSRPDVVLVEFPETHPPGEWIGRIKGGPGGPMVIVLNKAANPTAILAAFRAGADEFLHPPLEDNLRQVLERQVEHLKRRSEDACEKGMVLGFLSVKGGCGGTTAACGTAFEIARRQSRALLLDLDFQGGMVGFLTGITSSYSIVDAVHNFHRLDLDYWNALVSERPAGLHVLPSRFPCPVSRRTDPETVCQILRFARVHYPWTVADLGSGLRHEWTPLLEECDKIFLVTTVDVLGLYRCVGIIRDLETLGVERAGLSVLANRSDAACPMTPQELERAVGVQVAAVLPEDGASTERWREGHPGLPPQNGLGRALAEVASQLMGIPPAKAEPPSAASLWKAAFSIFQPFRRNA